MRRRVHPRLMHLLPKEVTERAGSVDRARNATEGSRHSNFDAGSLKTRHDNAVAPVESLTILGLDGDRAASAAVKDAIVLTEATNRIREWVNTPANAFTPSMFADKVKEATRATGLDAKVLDMDDMRRLKMGALLAVARGS